jgi:proteasome assembly chaperone (PAC2) family protein
VGHVEWDDRPRVRHPVLIAAFEGWNNAADAATTAARYLRQQWDARPFARIDPEEFYDFSSTRPQVRLTDGLTRGAASESERGANRAERETSREIIWPTNELSAAAMPGSARDAVILIGVEPQLKWRTFASEIVDVAKDLEVGLVLTLGALLADVPHTRPVRVTGTAADPELVARLGLQRSRYEGPTGIVGVLHDACSRASLASASLWAAVPHYVAATPSPKATLALVERASELLSTSLVTTDLEIASAAYERQVSEVVASDDDVSAYVERLEENADEDEDLMEGDELPTGETLVAELEKFLREQPRGE